MSIRMSSPVLAAAAAGLLVSCMLPPPAPYDNSSRQYVNVPQVVGLSLEQAQQTIAQFGLALGQVSYAASRYPQGTVLSQNPSGRHRVYSGSAVNLNVSSGTGSVAETTVVPNVIGIDIDSAVSALSSAGLSAGSVAYQHSPGYTDGMVIAQKPAGGTRVYEGGKVDMVVAKAVHSDLVTVPSVEGMHKDVAVQTLARYRLGYSISYGQFARSRPDYVMSQDPRPGARIQAGSIVALVAARPHEVRISIVPNLLGLTQDAAAAALSEAGLSLGKVSFAEGPPFGIVKSQDPSSGSRVSAGSQVDIFVGTRPKPALVSVPGVVGMDDGDARNALIAAGLALGSVRRVDSTDPSVRNGQVLDQDPNAGRFVAKGTEVSITVAHRTAPTVIVPGVAGLTLAQAQARISEVGLATGSVTYEVSPRPGNVLSQSPAANTRVYRGTAVSLVVGKAADLPPTDPNIVVVPSVILKSEGEAKRVLEAAGLVVGHIKHAPGLPRKRVMAQAPAPGMRVNRGSSVNLVISS